MKASIRVKIERYNAPDEFKTAVLTTISGHQVYILEEAVGGIPCEYSRNGISHESWLYREDGSRIMSAWSFGRTGKALRWATARVRADKPDAGFIQPSNGMNGATWHGHGCHLRFIDWDGSKYDAALTTALASGKKLLHAF